MEIRVYKTGEEKKIDIRNSSIDQVISSNQYKEAFAAVEARKKIFLSIEGERIIENADFSIFKDFSGNALGTTASDTVDAVNAILASNREVDSYVIGDDLSKKSSETIFTHNKAGTSGLGGRLIVDDENAKVNVTRTTGQGTTGLEVSATGPSGADLGSIVGKGAYSNATRTIFTASAASGRLYDSEFTVHDRFEVEGEANFLDAIKVNGNELSITDLEKVPSSLGRSGQVLAVNTAETALEFVNQSGGSGGTQQTLEGQYLDIVTRDTAYGEGSYEGQVLKFGTGTLVTNKVYVFTSSGWVAADADNENKTKGLFGLALGTSPTSDGLLTRGIKTMSGFSAGDTLYISLTEGTMTNTTSAMTTGDYVRVVGYALSNLLVYIDPSPDYIELS